MIRTGGPTRSRSRTVGEPVDQSDDWGILSSEVRAGGSARYLATRVRSGYHRGVFAAGSVSRQVSNSNIGGRNARKGSFASEREGNVACHEHYVSMRELRRNLPCEGGRRRQSRQVLPMWASLGDSCLASGSGCWQPTTNTSCDERPGTVAFRSLRMREDVSCESRVRGQAGEMPRLRKSAHDYGASRDGSRIAVGRRFVVGRRTAGDILRILRYRDLAWRSDLRGVRV